MVPVFLFQLLREKIHEYENKFKEMEEKTEDIQAEKVTVDSTYKQWVNTMIYKNELASLVWKIDCECTISVMPGTLSN